MEGRIFVRWIFALCCLGLVIGCSGEEESPTDPGPPSTVEIQVTSDPLIIYDSPTGKTSVVVQFIARDAAGYALDQDEVHVEMLVDGTAVDNESILQADSEELSASIYLSLVLDASYSMLQHDPPAFTPMLEAARDAIRQGSELYAGRPGTFAWNITWFNEVIHQPSASGRSWLPDDLLAIPEPGPGTATKLFAAVAREAQHMLDVYGYLANGPHDHHVMVVFSDGADNYSWFDNSTLTGEGLTTSGAAYDITGYGVTSLEAAVANIEAHPRLTSHVIGLGSDVRDAQLQAISDAGGGRYFKNPSSSQVSALFDQVTREFATIQDHGATIPLPPGDYTFGLRVWTGDRRAHDEISFQFHAGDDTAGVLQ
jgi:hypothetical protein